MTADTVGGVWTYALELSGALAAHGVEIALATMGRPLTAAQWSAARKLTNVEVVESRYKLEWMEEPWSDVAAAGDWLLELARRTQPDVVHLNSYAHAALPWPAPKLVVGHSCVLSWWQAVHKTSAPAEWNRYRAAVGAGLESADLVVAPSRAMLAALSHHYGPCRAGTVIPNGRTPAYFRPQPKEDFILAAGRLWDAAKNIGALAAVAPELPWLVYVAGEDKEPGTAARSAELQLRTAVSSLGHLSLGELSRWFGRASIYALPARYEPFGLSVLEAALSGCALVLGDIPSLRELWGAAAVFVPPEQPEQLKSALQELIAHPSWRTELANQARRLAAQCTPERMAQQYLQAYAQVRRTSPEQPRQSHPSHSSGLTNTVHRPNRHHSLSSSGADGRGEDTPSARTAEAHHFNHKEQALV